MTDSLKFDQEKINKLIEAIQKVAEAIVDVFQKIMEALGSIFNTFWEALKGFLKQTNPKLFRLAYYHPKQRVRKKNRARLFKMLRRCIKYDE